MTRAIVDIRAAVRDKRQQLRSADSVSAVLVHRVGVNLQTGVAIGYNAESICDAFTGQDPRWAGVASVTNSQNPYTFYIGGDLGGGQDGLIWQALSLQEIGWHARSASRGSIGIAMIGDFRRKVGRMPSKAQMSSLVWLVSGLCSVLGLEPSCVLGHGEVTGAHGGEKASGEPDACPGDYVDMDRVRAAVGASVGPSCCVTARKALRESGMSFDHSP